MLVMIIKALASNDRNLGVFVRGPKRVQCPKSSKATTSAAYSPTPRPRQNFRPTRACRAARFRLTIIVPARVRSTRMEQYPKQLPTPPVYPGQLQQQQQQQQQPPYGRRVGGREEIISWRYRANELSE
jgi:hypothetical protein